MQVQTSSASSDTTLATDMATALELAHAIATDPNVTARLAGQALADATTIVDGDETPSDWEAGPWEVRHVEQRAAEWLVAARAEVAANRTLMHRAQQALEANGSEDEESSAAAAGAPASSATGKQEGEMLSPAAVKKIRHWLDTTEREEIPKLQSRMAHLRGLADYLAPLVDSDTNTVRYVTVLSRLHWHNLYSTQVIRQQTIMAINRIAIDAYLHPQLQKHIGVISGAKKHAEKLLAEIPNETLEDASATRDRCRAVLAEVARISEQISERHLN